MQDHLKESDVREYISITYCMGSSANCYCSAAQARSGLCRFVGRWLGLSIPLTVAMSLCKLLQCKLHLIEQLIYNSINILYMNSELP